MLPLLAGSPRRGSGIPIDGLTLCTIEIFPAEGEFFFQNIYEKINFPLTKFILLIVKLDFWRLRHNCCSSDSYPLALTPTIWSNKNISGILQSPLLVLRSRSPRFFEVILLELFAIVETYHLTDEGG